jgi:hypothetical protein
MQKELTILLLFASLTALPQPAEASKINQMVNKLQKWKHLIPKKLETRLSYAYIALIS